MFGAYGSAPYGAAYYGQGGPYPLNSEEPRPIVGGTYGSATYGLYYYGAHIEGVAAPTLPPWVGGTYGTATYGSMYYGGHIQPGGSPTPPPQRGAIGGGNFYPHPVDDEEEEVLALLALIATRR